MPNEAGEQNQGKTPETAGGDLSAVRGDAGAARRPYVTPKLTKLGEVRDLTFGFGGSALEAQTGRHDKAPPRH
jgi:hypothetical protein